MYRCNNSLVQELFPEGNPKRCTLKRTLSATNHLKITLNSLLKSLLPRHSHYIRCIKPNEVKQAKIFEISLVQHQVRYLCLLPTVELWRTGYCYRLLYSHFLHRYKMLNSSTWPKFYGPSIEGVSTILKSLPLPGAEFIFGRTKVFVRSPRTVFELEEFRRERLHYLAALIQKCYRGYRQRRKFQKMRRSQRVIAAAWRTWRVRILFF
nr:unconventional myosin-Ib-like [Onthophagus taurus]